MATTWTPDKVQPKVAPRDPSPARRIALDVTAPPCPSCVHEPVCALRLALEDLTTVETAVEPLPAGLRLSLVATVSCDHYLRQGEDRITLLLLLPLAVLVAAVAWWLLALLFVSGGPAA